MIIEDDPDVRESMSAALTRMGYEVIDGGDGSDAIKIALSQEQGIDFLLTDVVLPHGQNGPDLASDISVGWPQMKVLLMTGYAENEILQTTKEDLMFPVIQKPFQLKVLGQKIQEVLAVE